MQELGIQTVAKRKYKATTDPRHSQPVAENHLNRQFTPERPNRRRYHLHLHQRRLALPVDHNGSLFA